MIKRRFTFICFSLLALLLLAFIYIDKMSFLKREVDISYTDLVNFESIDGGFVSDGVDGANSVLAFQVPIEKNGEYIFSYNLSLTGIEDGGRASISSDLFLDENYDHVEQQFDALFHEDFQNMPVRIVLNSGADAPPTPWFRIYFNDSISVKISDFEVHQTYKFLASVVIICFFLLVFLFLSFINSSKWWIHALIFSTATVSFFYVTVDRRPGLLQHGDTFLIVPTSVSLLKEGNFELSEYDGYISESIKGGYSLGYTLDKINNGLYSFFPLLPSVLSLPLVSVGQLMFYDDLLGVQYFVSYVLSAILIFLFFLFIYSETKSKFKSWVLSLIFVFATQNAYLMSSGALWGHLFAELMLVIILLLERRGKIPWLAIPASLIYMIRPSNVMVTVCVGLYVLIKHRSSLLKYALLSAAIFAPFVILNLAIYSDLLPTYFNPQRLGFGSFLSTFAALFFSPNRGLFIFTPLFLFSLYPMYKAVLKKDLFSSLLTLIFLFSAIIFALFQSSWWGGHGYGHRFFADVLPILVVFLIPILNYVNFSKRKVLSSFFVFATIISFLINSRIVLDSAPLDWNVISGDGNSTNIDNNPQRIWDWGDIQFLH